VKDEFGALADSFDNMADNIVGSVKNPLCIIGMDLNIIYVNEAGLALVQKSLDEIVGTPYSEISIYPTGSKYCPITALEEGREAEVYYAEGRKRYVRGSANYFLNEDGERNGYIIQSADVTEMYLTQLELEQAVRTANKANEHKGEFLARMSHEIRTPMNAIIGITNIVQRWLDEPGRDPLEMAKFRAHMGQIEVSSQHLLGLLNDILDISKIEAGKIELSEEAVDLVKLADTVAGIIRPRCEEKNIDFDIRFDTFSPSTFLSDSLRLRQVLINLLGNAVKFTPELGRIGFRLTKKQQEAGRSLVEFSISDTGIGITEEALATIFQPFEQGGGSISRRYGGTGLGLAISRRIVRLLGGEIAARSTPGEGSEFCFSLWLRETASDLPDEGDFSNIDGKFTGKRALLVDDVAINRMIVTSLLEPTGMAIDEAEDGLIALRQFEESLEYTYDIVFMDVHMPNMDGYEATTAIRALGRPDARSVPVIALTANAFKEDIDKALYHGMNAHIAKPIEIDKLMEVLFRFLSEG
jgi:signal transduction histidine kinase/CheY-like chemotaxis protein